MGIYLYLYVSKSVTKEEWEKVYEETLELVKKIPLADMRRVKVHGIETFCLVHSDEHEETYGWNNEKKWVGWSACGDYIYMRRAEDYYLPRDIVGEDEVVSDACDAIFMQFDRYELDEIDMKSLPIYLLWGNKTQGEPYHIYLLAIACLIEARLGTKAYIAGDITRGQCRKAVEIANKYLDNPIEVPDCCDMKRLSKRILNLKISDSIKINAMFDLYLGIQNVEFGEYIREIFSDEVIDAYWTECFEDRKIGTIGFDKKFNKYMLMGFELEKLCGYVNFTDGDGESQYECFIKRVMDAKLHLKEKNCEDVLEIDPESEQPYGIGRLMAQAFLAGTENKKVDRYIPVDEIRCKLRLCIGSKCNVDEIIDKYLEEEKKQTEINVADGNVSKENFSKAVSQDASEVLSQLMQKRREEYTEKNEKYDISDYDDLKYYENGDTMHPGLMKALGKSRKFLNSLIEETTYKELMKKTPQDRCEFIARQNRFIKVRDKDWDKVYTDIEEHTESFVRYYSLVRTDLSVKELLEMSVGLLINDDLYKYSGELAENF